MLEDFLEGTYHSYLALIGLVEQGGQRSSAELLLLALNHPKVKLNL